MCHVSNPGPSAAYVGDVAAVGSGIIVGKVSKLVTVCSVVGSGKIVGNTSRSVTAVVVVELLLDKVASH